CPNCKVPLKNNRHHFCPDHITQNMVCAIDGCDSPITADSHTCSDASHQKVEQIHCDCGQAWFQLKE
ncbi:hypothetical protein L208DRAFT_1039951, partial [Tricholoma matsutake]